MFIKNLLIIFLTTLLILSLAGNVLTLWFKQTESLKNDQEIKNLKSEIALQKENKNKIYQLGEKQADTNDKLVIQQNQVVDKIQIYIQEVEKSIRFVNGQAQILPTVDQNRLESSKTDLYNEIQKLKDLMEENTQRKENFKMESEQIYRLTNEDKPNRANPREGVR